MTIASRVDRLGMVHHRRPVKCGGTYQGQRQPGVIDSGVKVHKAAGKLLFIQRRTVGEHLRRREFLVQNAFSPAAGQIVSPQQALKGGGHAFVENAVFIQHRKHKRQALYQMAGIAAQTLTLKQRVAHQP